MNAIRRLESGCGHVAVIELCRPPHNHVTTAVMGQLSDLAHELDNDPSVRCMVLMAEGRVFCAGADFNSEGDQASAADPAAFYEQSLRLFDTRKPIVAAVEGAAVGAGLGLALVADFRVTCAEARFSANFTRLGFHPGFGLSVTLPRLVGQQQAALLFHTGRRIGGEEAVRVGLADVLASSEQVRTEALALAQEIATSAPLAVQSTRATLRTGLSELIRSVNRRELEQQRIHFATADFKEGVAAMSARRTPQFIGE